MKEQLTKCPDCNYVAKTPAGLAIHIRRIHKKGKGVNKDKLSQMDRELIAVMFAQAIENNVSPNDLYVAIRPLLK